VKGAIRRAFRDEFDIGICSFASSVTHLFPLDSVFILNRNILRYIRHRILDRKLANTPNGMLVNHINIINSDTYSNNGFLAGVMKMKIAGVSELTA